MSSLKKINIKDSLFSSSSQEKPDNLPTKEGERIFETDGQLAVDVYETESNFVVLAAVAGISSKDVEIQIDKDMLVIKGCRPNPENGGNKNYFYQECYWGSFSRKIILPEDIDISRSQAEFNKGLLTIKFPKNTIRRPADKKDISIKES